MRRGLVSAGLLLLAGTAQASTQYPAGIQAYLQLSYTPACSICHAGGDTDAGTVTTEFGQTMVAFGLQGDNNITSLDGALAGMVGEMNPYITDLKEGLDPNNPNTGPVQAPTYGCFNMTGQGPSLAPAVCFLLGLWMLLRRRRRL
jgi:hypothetical protein